MAKKYSWFQMRTSPMDRAKIKTVAELAETDNMSQAIRLVISFAINNAQLFKYWIHQNE